MANSQIIPKWVSQLDNIKDWQIATIYYLITCPALEFISVWSPTFLLVLLDELDKEIEFYLNILENGLNLDKHFLNKNLDAYNRLKLYSKEFKTINLWSKIKLISCWADASSELFYEKLMLRFPEINFQAKGLLSTEGIISAPDFDNDLLLTINSGFYEFICSKSANIYLADNLKENNSYEVIITTNAGLYRYKTGDIVRCKGYKNDIPIIKFQGRIGIISDMTGEKLTEKFVAKSIQNIKYFCMLIADKINSKYIVVIDENNNLDINLLRNNIENNLRKNPQYNYARKISQLPKLSILKVEKPLHKYINYRLEKGDKVGDIKIPALSLDNWTNHK